MDPEPVKKLTLTCTKALARPICSGASQPRSQKAGLSAPAYIDSAVASSSFLATHVRGRSQVPLVAFLARHFKIFEVRTKPLLFCPNFIQSRHIFHIFLTPLLAAQLPLSLSSFELLYAVDVFQVAWGPNSRIMFEERTHCHFAKG